MWLKYIGVFSQLAPECWSLLRREMSSAAGRSLACGWVYSGMEIKCGHQQQHLVVTGRGLACSWSHSSHPGGTDLTVRHDSHFPDYYFNSGVLGILMGSLQGFKEGEITPEIPFNIFGKDAKYEFLITSYFLQSEKKSHLYA